MRVSLSLLLVVLLASACSGNCPAIYYYPELTVFVRDTSGDSLNEFTLTVSPSPASQDGGFTVDCPVDGECGDGSATVPVDPGALQLDVVAGALSASVQTTPTYADARTASASACEGGQTGSVTVTVR